MMRADALNLHVYPVIMNMTGKNILRQSTRKLKSLMIQLSRSQDILTYSNVEGIS